MVNAQIWLDENFPPRKRKEITKLNLSSSRYYGEEEEGFSGDFPFFLMKSDFFLEPPSTSNHHPNQDIPYKGLESKLDLSDFVNLKELDCSNNQLTSLDVSNCPQLISLIAEQNLLKKLDVSNNPNLEVINVAHNRIIGNLLIFSHLTQLKQLNLANSLLIFLQDNNRGSIKSREEIDELF